MIFNSTNPTVFLVGAGPGNPGLLTLRAAEVLARADLVLYDQLVPERILDFANPAAEKICVRDLPGQHPDRYPHIHNLLIEKGKAGKIVVRLKGGDPLIFGRGGEEAEALRTAGVPYEIVPGVTAALAAGAFLELPLTHRDHASALALVTGHEQPNKPGNRLDWTALAAFPGTLCIYMGVARLPVIVAELLKRGKDPDTPSAIVERASTGDQRTVYSRLADLEDARRNAGLEAPGLIVIGDVVAQRPPRSWWESRPLFGKHVLVTRPAHQSAEMVAKLERLGAVVYRMPTVEIREPADFGPLDNALRQLADGGWDWIVFTSANGVNAVMRRIAALGSDLRILGRVKLAAIGPKTAAALREYHLNADVVPHSEFNSEGLAAALILGAQPNPPTPFPEREGGVFTPSPFRGGGQGEGSSLPRILLARANRGRDLLRDELSRIATVEQVTVYDQVDPAAPDPGILDALRRGEIHTVTLSSTKIAQNLLASFDDTIRGRVERLEIQLVAISPETGQAIRAMGYPVAAEATEFTSEGLIEAAVRLAQR